MALTESNRALVLREFRLDNLTAAAINNTPYPVKGSPLQYAGLDYELQAEPEPNGRRVEIRKSVLGTPVFTDITFEPATWTDENGLDKTTPRLVYETVLVNISQAKNIVKTTIQGGKGGTIKEYISPGDFEVTVSGIIVGSNGYYPAGDVEDLRDMLSAPIAIPVSSWFLQIFGINYLVVESFEIPQKAGEYSSQAFTLKCVSDDPTEVDAFNL